MNRRDFIKLLGIATAAVAIPKAISEVLAAPEVNEPTIDEWLRIFKETLAPVEVGWLEVLDEPQYLGKYCRGLCHYGSRSRYFGFIFDNIDMVRARCPEDFIREFSKDVRNCLLRDFRS